MAALVAVGSNPSASAGYVTDTINSKADGITQFVYRGSDLVQVPTCDFTCEDLWYLEREIPPQVKRQSLWAEAAALRQRVGVKVAFRGLGTVYLGVETFKMGYRVGNYLRDLWNYAELPAAPPAAPQISIVARSPDDVIMSKSAWPSQGSPISSVIKAPVPGFLVTSWDDLSQSPPNPDTLPDGTEIYNAPSPELYVKDGVCCWARYSASAEIHAAYVPLDAAYPPTLSRLDFDVQRVLTAPSDPGWDTVRQRVLDELNSHPERYPTLGAFLSSHTGGADQDPTADPEDDDCLVSPKDPTPPDVGQPKFAERDSFVRKQLDGTTTSTAMLYGEDSWGYYHVVTKHGWSEADRVATQEALTQPPAGRTDTTFWYYGPQYTGKNGTLCFRIVVVQTAQRANEPRAREIITSYGRRVSG
jgi:hypothetical protein